MAGNREWLEFLYNKHKGRCYYCGRHTLMARRNKLCKNPPTNRATIEHLHNKYDVRRLCTKSNTAYTVLACYKCNHERNIREHCVMFQWPKRLYKELDLLEILRTV